MTEAATYDCCWGCVPAASSRKVSLEVRLDGEASGESETDSRDPPEPDSPLAISSDVPLDVPLDPESDLLPASGSDLTASLGI